ncbi:hypothetical protein Tco_0404964 [Tanacetum coccineum]
MMQNVGLMCPEELNAWEKEEAGSPFVGDELGLHDNWLYQGLSLDGPIDVGGPSANLQVVLKKKKKGRSMVKDYCFVHGVSSSSCESNIQKYTSKLVWNNNLRHAIMNIDHLNGLIEMMEVMEFTLEIYDSVWCLREMVKAENKRLLGLNKHLVDAEEDIRAKEGYLEILEEAIYSHDMPIIDEVVFKIHKKGVFEFDPLRYELPECTPTKDDTLRCSSSTPIGSKLKRNSSKIIKEGLRKKGKAVGRKLIDSCDKGKEKVDEFPAATPTKEH